jgi:LPS export ABC transporter protein LptC
VGVFLSFWLSPPEVFLKKPVSDTEELPKADSYMLNIHKVDYGTKGAKAYSLKATEARHFKRNNRLELDRPQLVSYNQDNAEPPWHMTSKKGTAYNGDERVVLKGDVYAWQQLEKNAKNELHTEKLILFPNKYTAETDLEVTIITPR